MARDSNIITNAFVFLFMWQITHNSSGLVTQ